MPPKPFTTEQRIAAFWAKVNKHGPVPSINPQLGPCWLWNGSMCTNGYGQLRIEGRRLIKAHHFLVGRAPNGLDWDHLCRTRNCIRPDHLEAVTRSVNLRRGLQSSLSPNCPNGHPYTDDNTWLDKKGHRFCRTCNREKARRRLGWTEEAIHSPEKVNKERRKSHCLRGHPFDAMNTHISPQGFRQCRTCIRLRKSQRH